MSVQDLGELMKDVPLKQCWIITTIARNVMKTMCDNDLLVSEQKLLPKILEIAIKDINETEGLGIIKDRIILKERNSEKET